MCIDACTDQVCVYVMMMIMMIMVCVCMCVCDDVYLGQNHTVIGIYGVYTVFLAGKSPYIRSYTVQIYGSGQH